MGGGVEVEAKTWLRGAGVAAAAFGACLPLLAAGALLPSDGGLPLGVAFLAAIGVAAAVATRRLRRHAIAAAAAIFVVVVSPLADSTRIERQAELGSARFGFPLRFVEAELSATPPLPYAATWNPLEDPARLLVAPFLGSAAGAVGAAIALTAVAGRVYRSRSRSAAPSD